MHPFLTPEFTRSRTHDAMAAAEARRQVRAVRPARHRPGHSGRLQTRIGSALIGMGQRLVAE